MLKQVVICVLGYATCLGRDAKEPQRLLITVRGLAMLCENESSNWLRRPESVLPLSSCLLKPPFPGFLSCQETQDPVGDPRGWSPPRSLVAQSAKRWAEWCHWRAGSQTTSLWREEEREIESQSGRETMQQASSASEPHTGVKWPRNKTYWTCTAQHPITWMKLETGMSLVCY